MDERQLHQDQRFVRLCANGRKLEWGIRCGSYGGLLLLGLALDLTYGWWPNLGAALLLPLGWVGGWALYVAWYLYQNEGLKAALLEDYLGPAEDGGPS
jgi:hypothetical protein